MRLIHLPSAENDVDAGLGVRSETRHAVLATDVDLADSLLRQTRGLMFRRSLPDDYALVFQFGSAKPRDVHMLFVFVPIDAVWTLDGVVQRVDRLRPWRGFARENCDQLVELPAGAAADIEPGDRLLLETD